jgi:hypothetical protein
VATTTHDWASTVDADHLVAIRARAQDLAPSGALHLLLEVLAYAADEASVCGGGSCRVTLHRDCSVSVADDGRGTDTRFDERGQPVKRPVMSTPDVSFFEASDPPLLPEGDPRRGMSVVAALSAWLLHGNRRSDGAWTQRYRYGVPDTRTYGPRGRRQHRYHGPLHAWTARCGRAARSAWSSPTGEISPSSSPTRADAEPARARRTAGRGHPRGGAATRGR